MKFFQKMTNRKKQLLDLIKSKILKFHSQELQELRDLINNKINYGRWCEGVSKEPSNIFEKQYKYSNKKEKLEYHLQKIEEHRIELLNTLDNYENNKNNYCKECFCKLEKDNPEHNICYSCWNNG